LPVVEGQPPPLHWPLPWPATLPPPLPPPPPEWALRQQEQCPKEEAAVAAEVVAREVAGVEAVARGVEEMAVAREAAEAVVRGEEVEVERIQRWRC